MSIKKEREAFERHKAKQLKIDYVSLKNVLDDCERRFPNNRYAGYSDFNRDFETWLAAKAQAVPGGFVLVDKHQLAQLMADMDSFGKKALGDDYVSFADIAAVLDEAQEPTND
ncbi:hypothetical protein I9054_006915 [Acinetobacter bereziniae]|uniref:Uncharacterized protein n=1 Tax=Acinetobacter bereziniae TaxID=106648 RepID=A0A8I1AF53_ACIBZ|nr:hypothetical protein [Acinetobacter bereziniae]UUN99174.1 hypothetical protein I9054_006915 [Acinetobacter bereziniae]